MILHGTRRREFLKAGLLTAMLPGMARASGPVATMRFGLVTYLWGSDMRLEPLLSTCEAAGVHGIELRTTHAHGVEPAMTPQQRTLTRRRFEDSPVKLVGLGSDERFDWPDSQRLDAAIARTRQFLQLSHDVDGSGVKVKPDSFHKDIPKDTTIKQIGMSLRRLGPIASDLGQEVRLEVHGTCGRLPTIQKIMEIADHPSIRICWNCNRDDLLDGGMSRNFTRTRKWFGRTIHVRQLQLPGYPYQQLFDRLVETDYDGWVLLEARGELPVDRAEAIARQRKHFEGLVDKARARLQDKVIDT